MVAHELPTDAEGTKLRKGLLVIGSNGRVYRMRGIAFVTASVMHGEELVPRRGAWEVKDPDALVRAYSCLVIRQDELDALLAKHGRDRLQRALAEEYRRRFSAGQASTNIRDQIQAHRNIVAKLREDRASGKDRLS